ncbi:hypothetical protein [Streptomyces xanthophaeus]|uniref:hypothetical protein n=1 Tax=Streptomyces xanthophaeus TaxID=67385 RepID=UPI00264A31B9|nr:hypothetical protein [Streptomyces xanthophaeus]WKD32818.1 hypothetical protein KO717_13205 [Streptomyces xanthophaeus]
MESLAAIATAGHNLVLLGRERVLEDAWLSLADGGIALNWFEISHFNAEQRISYVDLRISRDRDVQNEAYVSARSTVLEALAGTVDGEQAESFVGYAPVLDAVAELLRKGNLLETQNAFASSVHDGRRISVLADVLDKLLERERSKTEQLADQFGLDPAKVYAPGEQMEWLAAELMGGNQPTLKWCPEARRADYVSQVQEFLRDHPFRSEGRWASPVFSAYVTAKRFGDTRLRSALRSVGEATGLLFEFVSADEGELQIDEWQFAALHSSLLAAEWRSVEASASITELDPYDREVGALPVEEAAGELILFEGETVHRRTSFQLMLDLPDALELRGPLSSLSVVFPAEVSVASGGSVSLGPDCFVRCADLRIAGDTVQISRRLRAENVSDGEVDESNVVLEITNTFSCNATLTGSPSVGSFELHLPGECKLIYPWVSYQRVLEPPLPKPDDRAVRFVNMMMNLLRNHGHRGSAAVFDKKLEGRQSIKGDEFRRVLATLQLNGVIVMEGSMIHLSPDWDVQRYSGKAREGVTTLDEKRDAWAPVLKAITDVIKP